MKTKSNNQIRKFLYTIMLVGMILSLCLGMSGSPAARAQEAWTETPTETTAPTEIPTETLTPTETPTETLTLTETPTETTAPTQTPTESTAPTQTPTETTAPTQTPTETTAPTQTPTETTAPTQTPTETTAPTQTPTEAAAPGPNDYYTVNTVTLSDGTVIEEDIIKGPPVPPPGFEIERQAVSLPEPDTIAGINILTVPAFNWVFGCSAVSGAMIAGYYDRNGYPNIYTGPTNGGVMPLDNSSWPTWSDGYATYRYPSNPLTASKEGVDGRTTRGSIDDYWVKYVSIDLDPYITNGWTQHPWGDAIGDYMQTSQSAFKLIDGYTRFYDNWPPSAAPFTCDTMASLKLLDGTMGRKLFYEARGYTVTDCYNQKTDNKIPGGFSFGQFKAEIDAGRPVMLNLSGHTIVGVGYDDSSNSIYIHDTWDYKDHIMLWGGIYAGMTLEAVSIVNLQGVLPPAAPVLISPSGTIYDTHPPYSWNTSSGATAYRLAVWSNGSASYVIRTDVSTSYCSGGVCTYHPATTLAAGLYRFMVLAKNAAGSSPYSAWKYFTVSP